MLLDGASTLLHRQTGFEDVHAEQHTVLFRPP
jgi:hypothetical protein